MLAAALVLGGLAPAPSWAADTPAPAGDTSRTPVPLNFNGSAWLGVAPILDGRALKAELRMSAGAYMPDQTNTFGAAAVMLTHDYFRLTVEEVAAFAEGLEAWVAAPHSLSVFSVSGGQFGLAAIGNAWSPEHEPIVVVYVMKWVTDPAGRGHHHGAPYVALSIDQAAAMGAALAAWSKNPTPPPPNEAGFLYTMTVY